MKLFFAPRLLFALLGIFLFAVSSARGEDIDVGLPQFPSGNSNFHRLLKPVMEKHDRIESARRAVDAAREQVRVARGGRYPSLELRMEAGREDEHEKEDPDRYSHMNMKLTQLLWDFGKTDAAVARALKDLIDKELTLRKIEQKFILDAAMAYQKLHRAYVVLQFSMDSEDNVRHQTGLEEIRVAEGSGYTTDVLQAKSQLASAVSRRLQNEGNYHMAESEY
ncbi:MAG: TolC family protein, partial [Desulfamplus sp.]|nr:TolC family protein [Desulfamplus sp.]